MKLWFRLGTAARFDEPDLKLVLVGAMGWNYREIVRKFLPWIERGELKLLEDVPSNELRQLYRHAAATICPSVGEGFDFSGVEAMRCGTAVVASDIKVHREIFGDAAEFFSPYDSPDAACNRTRHRPHPSGAARRTDRTGRQSRHPVHTRTNPSSMGRLLEVPLRRTDRQTQ